MYERRGVSKKYIYTHTHTHTRARARAHTHMYMYINSFISYRLSPKRWLRKEKRNSKRMA